MAANANIFLTAAGNGSQVPVSATNRTGGAGDAEGVARLRTTLNALLGGDRDLQLTTSQAIDLDAFQGPPRAAMGLQVAVAGRATVVNADVAQHLSEYQDPIKAIMNVAIHRDTRVIIKRKFVRGGPAEVVPERSQARTVSVVEEEQEAILTRYGADIEMSTNLMSSEPQLAAEDLRLKLDFQKNVLDERLTEIGYETVMSGGLSLNRSLLEHSPQYSNLPDYEKARYLDQISCEHTFAFQKYDNAFPNLLATVKRATPVTSGRFDTVIMPAGLPDIEKFSKADNTKFYLTGVPTPDRERVSFNLDQTFIDVPSGMRVAVTYPKVNNINGTLRPHMEPSGVQRVRAFATYHKIHNANGAPVTVNGNLDDVALGNALNDTRVVNFHTGTLDRISVERGGAAGGGANGRPIGDGAIAADAAADVLAQGARQGQMVFVRPRIRMLCSSMIVAKQGCGELLVAYPLTSVSTVATAPEQMRMQLRVFMGAAMYKSEDCVVCEDVSAEGVISGGGTRAAPDAATYFDNPDQYDGYISFINVGSSQPSIVYSAMTDNGGIAADNRSRLADATFAGDVVGILDNLEDIDGGPTGPAGQDASQPDAATYPTVIYKGSVWSVNAGETTQRCENAGHFGVLDAPGMCKRLQGGSLYAERPTLVKVAGGRM